MMTTVFAFDMSCFCFFFTVQPNAWYSLLVFLFKITGYYPGIGGTVWTLFIRFQSFRERESTEAAAWILRLIE
jgi:hypothetical protein